jgi:hypothetical protein
MDSIEQNKYSEILRQIISEIKSLDEAKFYIEQAYENNLTRNLLLNFIKAD